jgi:hypothetical protein
MFSEMAHPIPEIPIVSSSQRGDTVSLIPDNLSIFREPDDRSNLKNGISREPGEI